MQQFVALNVEELLWLRLDGKHVGALRRQVMGYYYKHTKMSTKQRRLKQCGSILARVWSVGLVSDHTGHIPSTKEIHIIII